jgi:beta-galactosidase
VIVEQDNAGETKGCTWKCIRNSDGHAALSTINVGKTTAHLKLALKGAES